MVPACSATATGSHSRWTIDGKARSNVARYFNHSCNPNTDTTIRDGRVFIFTLRPIKSGEELTYDYGIRLEERHTPRLKRIWACRCGARNCTGTILKSKR